ncbi:MULTISPECIES: ATP-binding protein [unclassified Thioalkalivibrio]|uniref:ATP-binding protein n=1 Tax=unclassified Thioalkalivibrio TaxID=2621013 RepID=UPI00035CA347|nr:MULTISPECIES: ATP-binding protein [unclassified Thioalkalivibrio]
MTRQTSLFDVLARHEGADTEYKSALGGLPGDLWATYSAFANTAGGTIYLGVKETDDGPVTSGITDADRLRCDFWNTVNNPQKVSRNILEERHVSIERFGGHEILVIEVPRASRLDRPVHVGVDPYKGTYRRNHEGDFLCNAAEVQRMFADRLDESPADSRILEHFGLDDLNSDSLAKFRNRMSSRASDHPWLAEDTVGFLTKLGGWRKDRQTGEQGLTLAGLLMFGKTEAIQDPDALPRFHLDYRERLAEDEAVRWSDRLTIDGTWEANLFEFYLRAAQKLSHDPALKVPFQSDRRDQTDAHEALKEALVNALIHADHHGQGGIVIERFKDRFEFSNPGTLLLSQEQLIAGGVSECRNKALQRMFQMLGVGDKAGSGLDKIRHSWQAHLWQPPSLREQYRPDRVILLLPLFSVMPEDVVQSLIDRFGSAFEALSQDEAQTLVIAAMAADQSVTNQRLQEMLTLHRVDITQMLRGLVDKGMLDPHGRNRGAYYTLAAGGDRDTEEGGTLALRFAGDPEPSPDGGSVQSSDRSVQSEDRSVQSEDRSVQTTGDRPLSKLSIDDPSEAERLWALSAHVRDHKPRKEELRRVLAELCRGRYLGPADLGILVNRNPDALRHRHLRPMAREGVLRMRYPDKPNHSQQQYTTVEGRTE